MNNSEATIKFYSDKMRSLRDEYFLSKSATTKEAILRDIKSCENIILEAMRAE